MTFVQNQEAKRPENVEYVTELIASHCNKGLCHSTLGPACANLCMSCSLLDLKRNVFLRTPVIVRHGDVLTVAIARHFGPHYVRELTETLLLCPTKTERASITCLRALHVFSLFLYVMFMSVHEY